MTADKIRLGDAARIQEFLVGLEKLQAKAGVIVLNPDDIMLKPANWTKRPGSNRRIKSTGALKGDRVIIAGDKVREAIAAVDKTHADVAQAVGVAPSTFSSYLAGRPVTIEIARRVPSEANIDLKDVVVREPM